MSKRGGAFPICIAACLALNYIIMTDLHSQEANECDTCECCQNDAECAASGVCVFDTGIAHRCCRDPQGRPARPGQCCSMVNVEVFNTQNELIADASGNGAGSIVIDDIPLMPTLNIVVTALPTQFLDLTSISIDWELNVAYNRGYQTDVVQYLGSSIGNEFMIEVEDYDTRFGGGDAELIIYAILDNQCLNAVVRFNIIGTNAAKVVVREALGTLRYQLIAWKESRFIQFSSDHRVWRITTLPDPATVLRSPDGGYGIGQLTSLPPGIGLQNGRPTVNQLWSWRANIEGLIATARRYEYHATVYVEQVRNGENWNAFTGGRPPNEGTAYPNANAFSEEQMNLEVWARYNSGFRYHNWFQPREGEEGEAGWVRRPYAGTPDQSVEYADMLHSIMIEIQNDNIFPAYWD